MTIRTIKIPYTCSEANYRAVYAQIAKEQANVVRFAFIRFTEGLKEKGIRLLLKSLNNITQDTWFQQSAIRAAAGIYESCMKRNQTKVQFGRKAFLDYKNKKINKEQLKEARTFGVSSMGEAPNKGNRKFSFVSLNSVIFKPQKGTKFLLNINPSKNQKAYIKAIIDLSSTKATPITVKLTKTHICMSFDVSLMKDQNYKPKANRIMGVDMNPNRFAFCIKDSSKIHKSESFDLMELRLFSRKGFSSSSDEKKYLQNKKTHEVIELAHYFVNQAKALHVEAIALEKLTGMKSQGNNKNFNRSVNNDFKRNLFKETIEKLCAVHGIRFIEILPQYTSFIGCVLYGQALPDPISAAACIADAGQHTLNQLNQGTKFTAWFNALKINSSLYSTSKYLQQWKQEDLCFGSVKELYNSVKCLFGSNGGMSLSYHAFLPQCALRRTRHKSEKSSIQRLYIL
jgi:IS605 OrfB family transposase